jgi:TPR repeat protein
MRRNSRAISSALMADRSGLFRRYVYLLLALLCSMLACAGVHASLLASADYNHDAIDRQFDIRDISYRTHWLQLLRSQAERASQEDEPYLANRLWEQLAQAGDRDAAYRLGLFYDVAAGDERDAQRAVYWYRRAAVAGEIHAQHNLGVAYAKGDGVSMNINEAIKWWTQAARHGNADSQYNLGILYAVGEYGIKPDIERAKHWWHKAALHGDAMAQYNLGTLYVNDGVHDYCEATHWWKEAAKNGVEQASLALRVIKTREDYHACR